MSFDPKLAPKIEAEIEDLGVDPREAFFLSRTLHIDVLSAALILAG